MVCSSYGEINMNSAGSIQPKPVVANALTYIDDEVGAAEKGHYNKVESNPQSRQFFLCQIPRFTHC
jgi:hypothetical protein